MDSNDLLLSVADAVTMNPSAGFWEELMACLARALNVDWALVGRFIPGQQKIVRTLAAWHRGKIVPNFNFQIERDAESNLRSGSVRVYPRQANRQLRSAWLKKTRAEAFAEITVLDFLGVSLGILAVAHSQKIEETGQVQSVLRIFAFKAAVELERELADERLYGELLQTLKYGRRESDRSDLRA